MIRLRNCGGVFVFSKKQSVSEAESIGTPWTGDDRDGGADIRPIVETLHIGIGDIDATVTHGVAEVVVPIGAVDVVVERVATLEHEIPFGIRETIVRAEVIDERSLDDDVVLAGRGGGAWEATRDLEFTDELVALVVAEILLLE